MQYTRFIKVYLLFLLNVSSLTIYPLHAEPSKTSNARDDYYHYIKTYCKIAIRQQKKYKIPASITLAQGLLESSAGKSYLALGGNNHFGIKCSNWEGLCIYKNHAEGNACYRKYLNASDSYEDHSRFLTERAYYRPLFKYEPTDYISWANGLKQCGYATDSQYASKLINLIETYKLYLFDTANDNDPNLPALTEQKTQPIKKVTNPPQPAPSGKKNVSVIQK